MKVKLGLHGKPRLRGRFGGCAFSGDTFYYTAEEKAPDFEGHFDPFPSSESVKLPVSSEFTLDKGRHVTHGEQMHSSPLTDVYSLSLTTGVVERVTSNGRSSQPCPTASGLLVEELGEEVMRLGKVYCYNRATSVVSASSPSPTPTKKPRFVPSVPYQRSPLVVSGRLVTFGGDFFKSHVGYVSVLVDGVAIKGLPEYFKGDEIVPQDDDPGR